MSEDFSFKLKLNNCHFKGDYDGRTFRKIES